jgi:hypothetical protein
MLSLPPLAPPDEPLLLLLLLLLVLLLVWKGSCCTVQHSARSMPSWKCLRGHCVNPLHLSTLSWRSNQHALIMRPSWKCLRGHCINPLHLAMLSWRSYQHALIMRPSWKCLRGHWMRMMAQAALNAADVCDAIVIVDDLWKVLPQALTRHSIGLTKIAVCYMRMRTKPAA